MTVPVESQAITSLTGLDEALASGLQDEWRSVIDQDPFASLFQSPGWCVPWYRCYAASYTPYVITVSAGGRMVGIVPMARVGATGGLVFATHAMADYRDIVALPGFREQVAEALVEHYLELGTVAPLEVGWLDPKSDTATLLARISTRRGLRQTVRRDRCWRWLPPAPAKPSAQKFLNWYKRSGTVTFEVVESEVAWARFRDVFYRQHTLRQIQAGRPRIFGETHMALYDALFRSPDLQPHVTAFCHNGVMLAGHFGYVWRGVLLLGPPSIRLEDEQRSPAVILLSWIIQNAAALGLQGFDFTIGDSDFKKRLANHCVELTMVEIHASRRGYYAEAVRNRGVALARSAVERAAGPDVWKTRIKPLPAAIAFERSRIAELGLRGVAGAARRLLYEPGIRHSYLLTPDAGTASDAGMQLPNASTRVNVIDDLLLAQDASATTARALTACARGYSRARAAGRALHTLVVDGALAGWCFSSADEILDGFILPAFRRTPAASQLIRAAARHRFDGGATEVRMTVSGDDAMFQPAASAHGRLATERAAPRVLGSTRLFDRGSRLWRRLTWRAIRRRLALAVRYQAEERIYRLSSADAADLPSSPDLARDRWDDLDRFVPTEPRFDRDACLGDWRQRRARGEHVYTRVEDGRLAAYGWMVERQKRMMLTWVNQSVELPEGSAVIYDYYTLPEYRHRDFYQRLLMHAIQDAARIPGTQWIYLSILASDTVPRWWVERLEMEECGGYSYSRILWRRKTWRSIPTSAHSIG